MPQKANSTKRMKPRKGKKDRRIWKTPEQRRLERDAPQVIPMYKTKRERRLDEIQRWMDENLPPTGTPEWEALCTGCGKCCYDKVWEDDRLLLLTSACPQLDLETNRCRVYAERFDIEPLCLPIGPEIIEMGGLPEDCPYVENFPGYRGPKVVDKGLDEMQFIPENQFH